MQSSLFKLAALVPMALLALPACTPSHPASTTQAVQTTSGGKSMDELNYEVYIAATDLADNTTVTATEANTELKQGHAYDIGVYVFAKSDLGLKFRTLDDATDARIKSCPVVETAALQVGKVVNVIVCDLNKTNVTYSLQISWWKDQTAGTAAAARIDSVTPALARGQTAQLSMRDFTSSGAFTKIAAADLGSALKAGGAYEFQLQILDGTNVIDETRDASEVDTAGGGQCVSAKLFNFDPTKGATFTLAACDLNDSSIFETATVVIPATTAVAKVSSTAATIGGFVPALAKDSTWTTKLSFRDFGSTDAFQAVTLAALASTLEDSADYELKLQILQDGNVVFESRDQSEVENGQGEQCLPAQLFSFDPNAETRLTISACSLDDSSVFETATLVIPAADGSGVPTTGGGQIGTSNLKTPVTVTGGQPLKDLGYKVLITYVDQESGNSSTSGEESVTLTSGHRYEISVDVLVASTNQKVFSTLDDGSARAKSCPSVFATAQGSAPINFTVCDLKDQTKVYDASFFWTK